MRHKIERLKVKGATERIFSPLTTFGVELGNAAGKRKEQGAAACGTKQEVLGGWKYSEIQIIVIRGFKGSHGLFSVDFPGISVES